MNLQSAVLLVLASLSLTGEGSKIGCIRLPTAEEEPFEVKNVWTYDPPTASLRVDLASVLKTSAATSCSEADRHQLVRIDLISTIASGDRATCIKPKKDSFVQASAVLNTTVTSHNFSQVQGIYFVRLSHCLLTRTGSCKMVKGDDKKIICIGDKPLSSVDAKPLKLVAEASISDADDDDDGGDSNGDSCEFEVPTKISADAVDSRRNASLDVNVDVCDINIRVVIPLCSSRQLQDTVSLTVVDADHGDACTFAEFETQEKKVDEARVRRIPLLPCSADDANATSSGCGDVANVTQAALLDHEVQGLSRNTSYCLFFRLNSPHCQGQFGCVFYTEVISCGLIEGSRRHGYRMIVTEPVFIAGVSLTLVASLALLAWTVIQCSKKNPGTPLMTQTQPGMKKPPRSLTEDDLEHISRLPSQEIVLVYFPDTKRFKELNRKLRNWLITLDVNDVKDIYDEKTTEEVLKNPEQWVRDTLAGPEKRIILVCSRLAYECLSTVKRGISSPRFVESDPHFGLLTRTVQYLDREMRGNYRNLICVRYEDLKICSRQYSSEAFNLVPGTEYVLPQHLEDIYRWIHPRQPNPDCWAETRPEVRDLLEAIRQYRHHDDNIFTVQFSAANMIFSEQ